MASYPSHASIPQSAQSSIENLGRSNIIDLAEDNTIRGASFATSYPVRITVVHEHRLMADFDTIVAHHDSEGATAFAFTFEADQDAYTMRYEQRPIFQVIPGAVEVNIVSVLVGTKD